ncbi:efflux RND transporter periplasmic adaptor subunit [Desulforamulus aquiferis]|uniref:Efflux RND transporter periplasmic adaptor subunit n=1 Tax=Desulforamulus aquiferis TaxID=1397668 RepID=A0AAW7ZC23_9FIRM|nr:efflux RND transporter periplasmic adaptor subunit [Desulforamulus aquiferis]MDO7786942.1 efflux RND transporter periplasmic adaptor subunit [Desulforamulus aquiferis]
MSKRTILTGLFIVSLLTGCGQSDLKGPAGPDVNPPTVTQGVNEETQKSMVTVLGKIEAVESADIVSKTAGKVEAVLVDIGSPVKAGQELIRLAAEDKAAGVEVNNAAVYSAQVNYDLALKDYERGKELVAAQAISQADFEKSYEGNFMKAEAALKSAQANLKKEQVALADMSIKAPFSGIIAARNVNPGEMAGTQNTLLSLVNLSQVVIGTGVDEETINRLEANQSVKVKVSAIPGKEFPGKITNIAPAMEPQTKTYPVKIQIDNQEQLLKPGMFAEVVIDMRR